MMRGLRVVPAGEEERTRVTPETLAIGRPLDQMDWSAAAFPKSDSGPIERDAAGVSIEEVERLLREAEFRVVASSSTPGRASAGTPFIVVSRRLPAVGRGVRELVESPGGIIIWGVAAFTILLTIEGSLRAWPLTSLGFVWGLMIVVGLASWMLRVRELIIVRLVWRFSGDGSPSPRPTPGSGARIGIELACARLRLPPFGSPAVGTTLLTLSTLARGSTELVLQPILVAIGSGRPGSAVMRRGL
jgi:hypothetical protein